MEMEVQDDIMYNIRIRIRVQLPRNPYLFTISFLDSGRMETKDEPS